MAAEETDALVIRMADFSESSRVVTLFTRDFGKVSALAKGAKRIKGAFESALDLLSHVRILFLRKSTDSLDLLTEAQLISRFRPREKNLSHLYGGYYVAELLDSLTEIHDPHPRLFDEAIDTLQSLAQAEDPRLIIIRFEIVLLREIGQLPEFETCLVCGAPCEFREGIRYWVSQGGLICRNCGKPEYQQSQIHPGTIHVLKQLAASDRTLANRLKASPLQLKELRRLLTASISHVLERRPKMLKYLPF